MAITHDIGKTVFKEKKMPENSQREFSLTPIQRKYQHSKRTNKNTFQLVGKPYMINLFFLE